VLDFEELDIVLFLWNYLLILIVLLMVRTRRCTFGALARITRRVMMGLTRGGQAPRAESRKGNS
jgi:hypothetical protein